MEEMDPGNALYFPFFALLVGCLLLVLFQDRSPLPYTVVLMLLGILVAVASYHFDLGSISHSIDLWVHVDPPEILLYVFLPPLLYESAFGSDWFVFRRLLPSILVLAFLLVFFNVAVVGLLTTYIIPAEWGDVDSQSRLIANFLVAAILSSTDPVAVVALLKEAGAPMQVRTLIEGESLLNDASAFVLFEVLLEVMNPTVQTPSVLSALTHCARLSVGGVAVGVAFGVLCALLLSCTNDTVTEISIALFGMYLGYYIAQSMGYSGVLSVVIFGLMMCALGASYISPTSLEPKHRFMEQLGFTANTVIFMYSGLIVAYFALKFGSRLTTYDYIYAIVWYLILNCIRALGLFVLSPLLRRGSYKDLFAFEIACGDEGFMEAELRGRVIQSIRNSLMTQSHEYLLTPHTSRILQEACNLGAADTRQPLRLWEDALALCGGWSKQFQWLTRVLRCMQGLRLSARIETLLYAEACAVAAALIAGLEAIPQLPWMLALASGLGPAGEPGVRISKLLLDEVAQNESLASNYLLALEVSFPEALKCIRTKDAALVVINKQLAFVDRMLHNAFVTKEDHDQLCKSIREQRRLLQSPFGLHRLLRVRTPTSSEVLQQLSFTACLSDRDYQRLFLAQGEIRHYSQGECIQARAAEGGIGIVIKGVVKAAYPGHELAPAFAGVGGVFGMYAALMDCPHLRDVHAAGNAVEVFHMGSAAVRALAQASAPAAAEMYRVCAVTIIDRLLWQGSVHAHTASEPEPLRRDPSGFVYAALRQRRCLDTLRQRISDVSAFHVPPHEHVSHAGAGLLLHGQLLSRGASGGGESGLVGPCVMFAGTEYVAGTEGAVVACVDDVQPLAQIGSMGSSRGELSLQPSRALLRGVSMPPLL